MLMKASHLRLKLVELNFASFTTHDQSNFNVSKFFQNLKVQLENTFQDLSTEVLLNAPKKKLKKNEFCKINEKYLENNKTNITVFYKSINGFSTT